MRRTGKLLWLLSGCDCQIDRAGGAATGKCYALDVPAVLTHDGHADAEAKAGAATGTLRGVEGIKDARKRFRPDADAVILNGDHNAIIVVTGTDLDAAGVADFLDGLLLETLEVGHVAAGENDALDIPLFVAKRTEIESDAAPIALFVAYANFQ